MTTMNKLKRYSYQGKYCEAELFEGTFDDFVNIAEKYHGVLSYDSQRKIFSFNDIQLRNNETVYLIIYHDGSTDTFTPFEFKKHAIIR